MMPLIFARGVIHCMAPALSRPSHSSVEAPSHDQDFAHCLAMATRPLNQHALATSHQISILSQFLTPFGNTGNISEEYPGAYKTVMCVSAVNQSSFWFKKSTRNNQAEIAAPGL